MQMKMAFLYLFLSLFLLTHLSSCSSEAIVKILTLHDSSAQTLKALSHTDTPVAVYVSYEDLIEVSGSVIGAEKWLRTHILTHYPSTRISTLVVGYNVLCNRTLGLVADSVFPSMRNLHYSLTRWGLDKEIEVSPSISSNCLNLDLSSAQTLIKPMLDFIRKHNYSYSIDLSSSEDALFSLSSHTEWVKRLGFSDLGKINLLKIRSKESKPTNLRRLSSMGSSQFSPKPTPLLPSLNPSPSPASHSVPSHRPHIPLPAPELPPLVGPTFPPPVGPTFPPPVGPTFPPSYGIPNLPPCNPYPSPSYSPIAPAPEGEMMQRLWCVAKPSVPAETLQVAMDYACGEGGADCGEIGREGTCYYPDTVVAHASYAFNNYWQKNKRNGGTCEFGGTAMLINADPSFNHCLFVLA